MRADLLHTVAVVANPIRYASRDRLYREFEEHMLDSGVKLTTVLCEYGDRPYALDTSPHVNYVRVRAKTLVWNKENLMNIGVSRLPQDWRYLLTADADVEWRKPGWASETVHALQHYEVVQPWSDCYDLGPNDDHVAAHRSFCALWGSRAPIVQGPNAKAGPYQFGHPGYAWAWTRSAFELLGGMLETAALGAADHHMAMALIGRALDSIHAGCTRAYKDHVLQWEERAVRHICGRIGHVPGTIEHKWHGSKERRAYVERWKILVDHKFDPLTDLKKNSYGVVELAGNKPAMARDIDVYFRQRDEDSNTLN